MKLAEIAGGTLAQWEVHCRLKKGKRFYRLAITSEWVSRNFDVFSGRFSEPCDNSFEILAAMPHNYDFLGNYMSFEKLPYSNCQSEKVLSVGNNL
jgi:hypothetical protein